jgi:hypothetical protein
MAKYRVQDEGCGDDFEAADDDAALAYAEEWLRTGDWDRSETLFLEAEVVQLQDDGDYEDTLGFVRVVLPPEEPRCSGGSHAWCSPYELLGGMKENPGVFGHGGGVRIHEVCSHCGVRRITDTWATNPCNGTQGHETVEYLSAGEEELEWVANQHEEVSDG